MKKVILSLTLVAFVSGAHAAESTFDVTAGAGKTLLTDKMGFDMALTYNMGLHEFFMLGFQPGFHWQKFDQQAGTKIDPTLGEVPNVVKQNLFMFPVYVNPTLRIPNASIITPYFGGGVGYVWLFSNGDAGNAQYDGGPATQLFAGVNIGIGGGGEWNPGQSALNLLVEGGYRWAKPTGRTSNVKGGEPNVEGMFIRAGIRMSLGGGSTGDF